MLKRDACRQAVSFLGFHIHTAPIAQLVELRTFNPQVPGSSPGGGTAQMNYLA